MRYSIFVSIVGTLLLAGCDVVDSNEKLRVKDICAAQELAAKSTIESLVSSDETLSQVRWLISSEDSACEDSIRPRLSYYEGYRQSFLHPLKLSERRTEYYERDGSRVVIIYLSHEFILENVILIHVTARISTEEARFRVFEFGWTQGGWESRGEFRADDRDQFQEIRRQRMYELEDRHR